MADPDARRPGGNTSDTASAPRRAPRLLPPFTLLAKARRDIRRQRAPFVAVAITVMLGVGLFIATFDAFSNLKASYKTTYDRLHFADLTVTGGDVSAYADKVRAGASGASVTTRTQIDLPMQIGTVKPYGRLIGLPVSGQPAVNRVDIRSGTYLVESDPGGVLIEHHAAEHFGIEPGATIRVFGGGQWHDLTVVGIVNSPEYMWPARSRQDVITDPDTFAAVFASEDLTQQMAGTTAPNQALIEVAAADADSSATLGSLERAARRAGATDVQVQAEQPSNSALHEDITGFAELSLAFPLLFLTAAAVAAHVLLTRQVLTQRPIIAMLCAAGARRGPVVMHYLGYGVFAGLLGAIPGVILGVVGTTAVTRAYTQAVGVPDTVVAGHPWSAIIGLMFGVLVGVAGAGAPALAASRVAPAEAMRQIAAGGGERPGWWSRSVTRARWLPTTVRLALRDVVRSRRRTIATMVGVTLALVLVISSGGMIDSTRRMLHLQFDDIQQESADVLVDPARQSDLVARLQALPDVTAAEAGITGPMTMSANGESYTTSIFGYRPDTVMHRFHTTGGSWVPLPTDGILAGRAVASLLDVAAGDVVTLTAADGSTTSAKLTALLDEPLGTFIYATVSTTTAALGSAPGQASLVLARFTPDADGAALRRSIGAMPGVVAYADAKALQAEADKFMALFWAFMGIMVLLGGILAFVTIFITMTVSVAERTNELATLRAAGVRVRRIATMLGNENLVATLLGVPFGLVLGYGIASVLMQSFSNDMFRFDLSLSASTLALSVFAVVAAAMLSQIPALRSIKRLDVARVVRERSA